MKQVQPFRSKDKVQEICNILKSKKIRDYFLIRIGTCTGFRISDILALRVLDLKNKDYLVVREEKTDKIRKIKIHPNLKAELAEYLSNKSENEYIFKSQKDPGKHIDRVQAWRIINNVARQVGLTEVGTHSLRKTFGYFIYNDDPKKLSLLQDMFNHSSQNVTLRYIGIVQDDMDKAIESLDF